MDAVAPCAPVLAVATHVVAAGGIRGRKAEPAKQDVVADVGGHVRVQRVQTSQRHGTARVLVCPVAAATTRTVRRARACCGVRSHSRGRREMSGDAQLLGSWPDHQQRPLPTPRQPSHRGYAPAVLAAAAAACEARAASASLLSLGMVS
jgi:hypothetical protein